MHTNVSLYLLNMNTKETDNKNTKTLEQKARRIVWETFLDALGLRIISREYTSIVCVKEFIRSKTFVITFFEYREITSPIDMMVALRQGLGRKENI